MRRTECQQGATAIIVALSATMIFGLAALAVDLGNAYARRTDIQTQVDLAVLAGARDLPAPTSVEAATVTDAVRAYLAGPGTTTDNNLVQGQDQAGWDLSTCGADDADGCLEFLDGGDKIRLTAPNATVQYGLAAVLGESSMDVSAVAAADIRSPGTVMPAYAVGGCDYGPQTLLSPSSGGDVEPELYADSPPYNGADLASLTPDAVALNTTGQSLTINGTGLDAVTRVAFSLDGGTPSTGHLEVAPNTVTPSSITLSEIPPAVTAVEDVWYVRLYKGGRWSNPATALPLLIGDAFLECSGESSDGNFGALRLPRDPDVSQTEEVALNIANGLDFTMEVYAPFSSPWTCYDGDGTAVVSTSGDLHDETNCVDTETGFPANAATQGLITGVDGEPGRLDAKPTSPRCGGSDLHIENVDGNNDYDVNNDTLTCFFTNDTTQIGDIDEDYAGPGVISAEIFDSPRFFWVPVLGVTPTSGGSDKYQLVDFRPAFITDQPVTATRLNPQPGDTENGLVIESSGITQLKVVFFSVEALPATAVGVTQTMAYIGAGTKIIRLVE